MSEAAHSPLPDPPRPPRSAPSWLAKYGPISAILAAFAITVGILVTVDPIRATGDVATTVPAARGAESLADIDDFPDGVMPYAKAKADGTTADYEWGERCDTETGLLALPLSPAPACFARFEGDNGGSTATGVTGDTIKVVAYLNKRDDPVLKFIYGQIGLTATVEDTQRTYDMVNEIFGTYFETYDRTVELEFYNATGGISDPVAAAADAETIARDLQPFAVLGGPQLTGAFGDTLAANKILCIGCANNQSSSWYEERSPYIWDIQKSLDQNFQLVTEYLLKRLAGRPAAFAGDPKMHDKKRVFAFVHASTAEGSKESNDKFKAVLAEGGVEFASVQTYSNPLTLNTEGRDMITKLKEAGVTSVLLATDPIAPQSLTAVATDQNYFPEWIMTGQTLVESTVFSRTYDQKQWAHAFGPTNRFPYVKSGLGSPLYLIRWYFGEEAPAQANTLLLAPGLQVLYNALQGMGPTVSADAFKETMFRAPIIPGSSIAAQISFGNRGFFPDPDFTVVDDQTEMWWDAETVGPSEGGSVGQGVWQYSDMGKRYVPGEVPEKAPSVFDPDTSIYAPDDLPPDAADTGDYAPIDGPRKGRKLSRTATKAD